MVTNYSQLQNLTADQQSGLQALCGETGHVFTIARDGSSMNYAQDAQGTIFSDAGVDIRERRALLDRSQPFTAYVASDARTITGWKGNILATVIASHGTRRKAWGGGYASFYRVRDIHGAVWSGYGSEGMAIHLRARD